MTLRRAAALALAAAALVTAMHFLHPQTLVIETAAEEPKEPAKEPPKDPPKDEFPFSPRPNRAREIHWQKWSAEAFAEAKKAGKPVAVSLTATWCQKCHEMDEGAFSDEKVIALLNEKFLCIRVDTDKQPEVKDRYLSSKGWPTTAICVPSGEVITKTWFLPAAEFLDFAQKALDDWTQNRDAILQRVSEMKGPPAPAAAPPEVALVKEILKGIRATSTETGWAAGDYRFPSPANVELYGLWLSGLKDINDDLNLELGKEKGLEFSLKLEDPVEFGFYRVAMKPDWTEPHFEKLLETNAAMLAVLGDTKAASRTVEYLQTTLAQPDGGWSASQDADADYFKLDKAGRAKREKPRVDASFYSGVNAQAASAFLAYAAASGDGDSRKAALAALERVFRDCWTADGLEHGAGGARDLLRDLALLGDACLDAHQATGEWNWVKRAGDVAARIEKLADKEGALLDRPLDEAAPGALRFPIRKSADNGRAAGFLVRLFHLTDEEKWKTLAAGALKATGGEAKQYPAYSAEYAIGVLKLVKFPLHIVIVGPKAELPKMVAAADRFAHPWKTVTVLESSGGAVKHAGLEYPAELAAYACVEQACGPPVSDAAKFEEMTKAFLERNK